MKGLLLHLLLVCCSITLFAQPPAILKVGDFAILGVNANVGGSVGNGDEISFVCFKDITTGTQLQLTDNGYSSCRAGFWSLAEGGATVTRTGGTIPAGTVVTLTTSPLKFTFPDNAWSVSDLLPGFVTANFQAAVGYGGINMNAGGDQIYFAQGGTWTNKGGSCISGRVEGDFPGKDGRILFGFSTGGTISPWTAGQGNTTNSGIYPGMGCFSMALSGKSDFNKYIGPITPATQKVWITRIANQSNWRNYSSSAAYTSATPNLRTLVITINAGGDIPDPSWNRPDSALCNSSFAPKLNLKRLVKDSTVGVWSGTGVSGSDFISAGLSPGAYPITYSISYSSSGITCPVQKIDTLFVVAANTPKITITANPTGAICKGDSVKFTATITNGGVKPKYQWNINGIPSLNDTLATFKTGSLIHKDSVTCTLISNDTCITKSTVISDTIGITVNNPPLITKQTSVTDTAFCLNKTLNTLSITASNANTYQWYKNTIADSTSGTAIAGATNSTYTPQSTVAGTTYYYCVTTGLCTPNDTSAVSGAIVVYDSKTTVENNKFTLINAGDLSPSVNDSTDFGDVNVGNTLTRTFKIKTSDAPLSITAINVTGDPSFSVSALTPASPIKAKDSATFTVTFSPTSIGIKNATITIVNTGCNAPSYQFAVIGNAVQYSRAAALDFDGVNDYVTIPHHPKLKPAKQITIEAWVFPRDIHTNTFYEIYRKEDGGNRHLLSFQNNGTILSFGLNVAGVYKELDVAINKANYENKWVHIAATFDGKVKKLYANGVLIGSANEAGVIGTAGTAPALIGQNQVSTEYFNGKMDEFRLWSRALCQAEILHTMNCQLKGNEDSLIVYYTFNQGLDGANNTAVNTLLDSSQNNLNGILTNFTLKGSTSNWVAPGAITSYVVCTTPFVLSKPTINITPSNPAKFCKKTSLSFTANITNGGTAPRFVWKNNGVIISGATNTTYTTTTLNNNDKITCELTSNLDCVVIDTAISNSVTVSVTDLPNVVIKKPASVCAGKTVDLGKSIDSTASTPSTGLVFTFWKDSAATVALTNPQAVSVAGTYYIKATTTDGCTDTTKPVIVSISSTIPTPTASVTQPTCAKAADIQVTSATTAYTFSIDGTTYIAGGTWNNVVGGVYSLTAKDNNGCISSATSLDVTPQPLTPAQVVISPTTSCESNTALTYKVSNGSLFEFFNNKVSQTGVTKVDSLKVPSVAPTDTFHVRSYYEPTVNLDGDIIETSFWGPPAATSQGGPVSGFASKPELNALYVRQSAQKLYLALAGTVHNNERILVFIDSKTGGYNDGNFGRNSAPTGLYDYNQANKFDVGFNPDYALTLGTNTAEDTYYADLYTLSGFAGSGGGPNRFLGDNKTSTSFGAKPTPGTRLKGFEIAFPWDSIGYKASFGQVKLMAMYILNNGTISNQFLPRANAGENDYGKGFVDFSSAAPGPVSPVLPANCYTEAFAKVNKVTSSFTSVSICKGNSYPFNGKTYTIGIKDTVKLVNSVGCDSLAIIEVKLKDTTSSFTSVKICKGSSYTFNGKIYTTAIKDTFKLVNSVGCDSLAIIEVKLKDTTSSFTSVKICKGGNYTFNGKIYTTAIKDTFKLVNSVGCDSLAIIEVKLKDTTSSFTSVKICKGGNYTFNGKIYTTAIKDTFKLVNSVGCDSLAIIEVKLKDTTSSFTSVKICKGSSYTFNGKIYTTAIKDTFKLVNSVGCDSLAIIEVKLKDTTSSFTSVKICKGGNYTFNGKIYTTAIKDTFKLVNSVGCDSLAIIEVKLKDTTSSFTSVKICKGGNYTFNGKIYTTAIKDTFKLVNSVGCDSLAIIEVKLKDTTSSFTSVKICKGGNYTFNGKIYTTAIKDTFKLVNSVGCDSLAIIEVKLKDTTSSFTSVKICRGGNYTFNGKIYTTAIKDTFKLVNSVGCDSLAIIEVKLKDTTSSFRLVSICKGSSYTFNGKTYTKAVKDTFKLVNSVGCDSLAIIEVKFKDTTSSFRLVSICKGSSYTFNGKTYTKAIKDTFKLVNSVGCDSLAIIEVKLKDTTSSFRLVSICKGSSYTFNGKTYTKAVKDTFKLVNSVGCDSLAIIEVKLKDTTSSFRLVSICKGSSYTFNGKTYTKAVKDTFKLVNSVGCDSLAIIEVKLKDTTSSISKASICPGASYTFNGVTYTKAGTYSAKLVNKAGCDSVAVLILTLKKTSSSVTKDTICAGSTYNFNGKSFNKTGTYIVTLNNSVGCDSLANLNLFVRPTLVPSISISSTTNTICSGASVTFTATPVNGGSSPTYQWKVSGVNAGTNSPTFTTTTLTNNAIVTCELTSNATCAAPVKVTSNSWNMVVNPILQPTVTISSTASTICAGTSVTFTAKAVNGGTKPTYQWKVNGGNVGGNATTYTTTGLINNALVTCIVTSNATCAVPQKDTSNVLQIVVNPILKPSISIVATASTICSGISVTFTASIVNGGVNPTYQWKVNGSNVGGNSATYTTTTLANNAIVTCELTSKATCAVPSKVTSNGIRISVNPILKPSVSIKGTFSTICSGASVKFTATPVNGGSNPTYQWKVNGVNAGTNSPTFTTTTLTNNAVITCELTSNATCASPVKVTSNSWKMVVNPILQPTVTITGTASTICAGTSVTFTAKAVNGGTKPTYQWKVNGGNVGGNANTFTTTGLSNNAVVTCELTSNAACILPSKVFSNGLKIVVNPILKPAVSIVSSASTICSGSSITFTANAVNGGINPSYQWKVNGSNVGSNSATYTTTTLANNAIVTCELTSKATCAVPSKVTSNAIRISVNPLLKPSVSISSTTNTICSGTSVKFTATPVNGGSNPTYQWKVNGANGGTNSPTFTTTTLTNNAVVTCELTSKATCAAPVKVTSNSWKMVVNPILQPTVTITGTASTICAGTSVTFTAKAVNGGTKPTYQWKVNGGNVGGNASTYTTNVLPNNAVVTCELTSNAACILPSKVISNGLKIVVNPILKPSVSIVSSASTICSGRSITFTANAVNGGINPSYQWKVNGSNVGSNSATYTTTTLANNAIVSCELTSNATCAVPSKVTSNGIKMTVNANLIPSVKITASSTSICAGASVKFTATSTNGGTNPTYQWKKNGVNVGNGGAVYTAIGLVNNEVISCELKSSVTCLVMNPVLSNAIVITVNANVTPAIAIAPSATSFCAGSNAGFSVSSFQNGGTKPQFTWRKNGTIVGTNANSYFETGWKNGDLVTCALKSNAACVLPDSVNSTALPVTIINAPVVAPIQGLDSVCAGGVLYLTNASPNGAWASNKPAIGTISSSGIFTAIKAGTTNISYTIGRNSCTGGLLTSVKSIKVLGIKPNSSVSIGNPTCLYPDSGKLTITTSNTTESPYQFVFNNTNYPGPTAQFNNLKVGIPYIITIKNQAGCTVDFISRTLSYSPTDGSCDTLYVPTAFRPTGFGAGYNSRLKPFGGGFLQSMSFRVYNRFGGLIFESHDIYDGWDGTAKGFPQEPGTYVWFLEYTRGNGIKRSSKGTTVLIR